VSGSTGEIARLVAAAEPTAPKRLDGLLARLAAAGLLNGAVRGGAAVDLAVLAGIEIRSLAYDSRRAGPEGLFVAIPGARADGHAFLPAAENAGAVAALVERPNPGIDLAQVVVADARRALAFTAAWWYDDPSASLGIVGITGTDGKTTTSFLAVAAMERAGISTGLIGTVETKVGTVREANPEHVTTPEAPELQATLRAIADAGDRAAVVETTSHGLALHRVEAIAYDAAVFTNLTHEHLELHGTFEAYRAAKVSLFERLAAERPGRAWPSVGIVNRDDTSAPYFEAATRQAGAALLTYGTGPDADVRASNVEEDLASLRFDVAAPGWSGRIALRLAGQFNVHNALAVVALGRALDLDPDAVREGIEALPGVPGRMQRIDAGQPFGVIVDFAHSPASLDKVLGLLGPSAAARGGGLIVVFGSAGERDRGKRPMMGRVAGEHCRLVVVADEDPRGEDPVSILEEIGGGAEAAGRRRGVDLLLIADRRAAIAAAFERARPGDIVLLAGKGHEQTVEYASGNLPWNEAAVAREALAALGYGAA
jgi:UDP-N-acetylmuramoyl-L-alanyl-D-glutamate--2,6-diaminopimelate ligase